MNCETLTCDINLLESAQQVEGFYAECVRLVIESEISEEEKEAWIQRMYSVANTILKKGREQLNFFSLAVSTIMCSTISLPEKRKWIVHIESKTLPFLDQEGGKENFYAMCMVRVWSSSLSDAHKKYWSTYLQEQALSSMKRSGQKENFYSMICTMLIHSSLSTEDTMRYLNEICTSLHAVEIEERQHILSYCVVRIARNPGACSHIRMVMAHSPDVLDLKKRSEDLIFDLFLGEKALEILSILQSCYTKSGI